MLDCLGRDLRFALRQLRSTPGFTVTSILVLALGMCASLAIFAFVDAALIKPLPYREPARLVGVYETNGMFPRSNLSYPDYLDWKKRNTVFGSLDVYQANGFKLTTPAGGEPVRGVRVSDGFFHTLGVNPILGRDFRDGEDLVSAARVGLISYSAWQQRYGGKRDVLGQVAILDDNPTMIIGVLPREFHFAPTGAAEYYVGFHPAGSCDIRRSCHGIFGVARLKDGVAIQAAFANVVAIAKELERQYPDSNRSQGAALAPLADVIVGDVRGILLALFAGAGLLLLIAAVNVTGLVLLRSEGRKREIAVRTALGASSARLTGQFATEAVVLAAAGGGLGLACARWAIQLLQGLISPAMMARTPFLRDLGLNGRVLGTTGAIALGAALLLAFPPSLRIWSAESRTGLAEASRGSSGTAWRRLGSKLVVVELAMAVVLLSGAGLFGKSLYRLLHVSLGIRPDHLVTIDVSAPDAGYGKAPQALALAELVTRRAQGLPGVTSAGVVENGAPVSGNGNTAWIRVLGHPWHGEHYDVAHRYVSTNYFATIGASLERGRQFQESDDPSHPHVAIVNQAFVKQHFPGEDPLGRQLAYVSLDGPRFEIVGVVENIREGPLDAPIPPVLYTPFKQGPDDFFTVVVRTTESEGALVPALAALVRQIDPAIVTMRGATMKERLNDSQSAYLHRSLAWFVGGFAMMALVMGLIGLYGVIAYSVSQRSREIGIRMALGAEPRSVRRLILREGARLALLGTVIGLAGAVAAAQAMRGLLFGVRSWDAATLAPVAGILAIAALAATFLPAQRAAAVDPVDALRAE
ncbi:MAG TPA: ABC transporter permease [Bryobacteraceae bacterium]|nr:ABC transporter permease [Bryobacteraceae bacterium]